MNAVDTNVVVRYLTNDHGSDSARARELIDSGPTLLLTTVVLESEWVLRSVYRFEPRRVIDQLVAFAGLPTVVLEAPATVHRAFVLAGSGLDFADALHLAAASKGEAFYTFDRALIRRASKQSQVSILTP